MFYIKGFLVIECRFKTIQLDFNLYRRYNIECLQVVQDELQRFFKYKYIIENLIYQMDCKVLYIYIYQHIYIII